MPMVSLIVEAVARMLEIIKDTRFVRLRLPRDFYAEVEARAAAMGRTVAMETVELVRAGLAGTERLRDDPTGRPLNPPRVP